LSLLEKLFFILYYFKTYPTYDVLAADFDVDRGTTCRLSSGFSARFRTNFETRRCSSKRVQSF